MIQTAQTTETLPRTLEEFIDWEPNDGSKYEWNDGEIIKSTRMKQEQYYIYDRLNYLFFKTGYIEQGSLAAEQDIHLSGIQMRRPDICYLTRSQALQGREGMDMIPAFVVEIISRNDQINQMEKKLTEYFIAGVQVVWTINPQEMLVNVYTSRREVKICIGSDVCSAAPVLPDFEIRVDELLTWTKP